MKKLTSILAVALSLLLVIACLPIAALAADNETVAVIWFEGEKSEYTDLSTALTDAAEGNLTVYLVTDYKLPSNETIPSGVTLIRRPAIMFLVTELLRMLISHLRFPLA